MAMEEQEEEMAVVVVRQRTTRAQDRGQLQTVLLVMVSVMELVFTLELLRLAA